MRGEHTSHVLSPRSYRVFHVGSVAGVVLDGEMSGKVVRDVIWFSRWYRGTNWAHLCEKQGGRVELRAYGVSAYRRRELRWNFRGCSVLRKFA